MTYHATREELRSDILEITTAVFEENNYRLRRMINEDLYATNLRIDNLGKRMTKRFKEMDQRLSSRLNNVENEISQLNEKLTTTNDKIDFTHKLLHVHVANPSAHSQRHA
jgi:guanylate kinase